MLLKCCVGCKNRRDVGEFWGAPTICQAKRRRMGGIVLRLVGCCLVNGMASATFITDRELSYYIALAAEVEIA